MAEKVTDGAGEKIVLKPCTVTPDADGKVASASTAGAKPLYLLPGTYDFYAITPAFASADHKSVSVAHGDDFASSLTAGVELKFSGIVVQDGSENSTKGAVTLTTLDRKCSKIVFDVSSKIYSRPADGGGTVEWPAVKKVEFKKVKLFKMAPSPVANVVFNSDITPDAKDVALDVANDLPANGVFIFPSDAFATFDSEATPATTSSTGSAVLLPKSDATFGLYMELLFNGATDDASGKNLVKLTTDQMPKMPFVKDVQYRFGVKLKGTDVVVTVSVLPWDAITVPDDSTLGEGAGVDAVVMGAWTDVPWNDASDLGADGSVTVGPDSWTPNPDWSADFGEYLNAIIQSGVWTESAPPIEDLGPSATTSPTGNGTWTTINTWNPDLAESSTAQPNGNGTWSPETDNNASDVGSDASATGSADGWTNTTDNNANNVGSGEGSTGSGTGAASWDTNGNTWEPNDFGAYPHN